MDLPCTFTHVHVYVRACIYVKCPCLLHEYMYMYNGMLEQVLEQIPPYLESAVDSQSSE